MNTNQTQSCDKVLRNRKYALEIGEFHFFSDKLWAEVDVGWRKGGKQTNYKCSHTEEWGVTIFRGKMHLPSTAWLLGVIWNLNFLELLHWWDPSILSNERDFPDYIKINKLLHVTLTKIEKTRNEYPPKPSNGFSI